MAGLRKAWRMTVAVAAAMMLTAWPSARGQDLPAGLSSVPADSEVVVIIANPQVLDQKVADLAEKMGVSDPSMQSPLAHLKQEIGLVEGVRDDAAWIVVVQDLPMAPKPEDEIQEIEEDMPAMLLAPVTDYQAFLKNFEAGASVEGVTEVSMPDGTPGYVRELEGGYALLGASKQRVTSFEPAGGAAEAIRARIGAMGVQAVGRSDVAVVLNMESLGPKLRQKLQEAVEEAKQRGEVTEEFGGGSTGPISGEQAAVMALNLSQIWVSGLQGAVLGADLTEQGVGLSSLGVWKPGSVMAGRFKGGLSASALMTRLPKSTYLLAGALNAKAIDLSAMVNDVAELLKDVQEPMTQLFAASLPVYKLTEAAAFTAELSPDFNPMMPGNPFKSTAVIQTSDGQAYLEAIKQSVEAMKMVEIPMPQPSEGQEASKLTMDAEFVPDQVQIDGTSVHLIRTRVKGGGPGGPAGMMSQDALVAVTGAYAVTVNTPDSTAMSDALAAVKKTDGLGVGDPIAQARADYLPADPAGEFYINPKGLETGVNMMFMMMGGQPVSLPEDLPPLTAGLNVGDGAAQGRLVLPIKTILYVSDLVRQSQAGSEEEEEEPSTAPDMQEEQPQDQDQAQTEQSDSTDSSQTGEPRNPFAPAAPR